MKSVLEERTPVFCGTMLLSQVGLYSTHVQPGGGWLAPCNLSLCLDPWNLWIQFSLHDIKPQWGML